MLYAFIFTLFCFRIISKLTFKLILTSVLNEFCSTVICFDRIPKWLRILYLDELMLKEQGFTLYN